jgi:hypothetical protein
MIAAFLRTIDGDFDYGPAFGAAIFTTLLFIYVWTLYAALKKGFIPFDFVGRFSSSKIYKFERNQNPGRYWFAFSAYSLMIPFCIWTIYALCTGFFHQVN